MSDREKLIEILTHKTGMRYANEFADHLIANGVTVQKCKIGDFVYALWSVPTKSKYVVYCAEVKEIRIARRNCRITTTYMLEPIEYRGRIKEYRSEDFGNLVLKKMLW